MGERSVVESLRSKYKKLQLILTQNGCGARLMLRTTAVLLCAEYNVRAVT